MRHRVLGANGLQRALWHAAQSQLLAPSRRAVGRAAHLAARHRIQVAAERRRRQRERLEPLRRDRRASEHGGQVEGAKRARLLVQVVEQHRVPGARRRDDALLLAQHRRRPLHLFVADRRLDDVVEHRRALAQLPRPALDAAAPRLVAVHAHGDRGAHAEDVHEEVQHGVRCFEGALERREDVALESDRLRLLERHDVGVCVAEAHAVRVRAEGEQHGTDDLTRSA